MKNQTRADLKQEIKMLNRRIVMLSGNLNEANKNIIHLSDDVDRLQLVIEGNNYDYESLETSYIDHSDKHRVSNTKVLVLGIVLIATGLCLL